MLLSPLRRSAHTASKSTPRQPAGRVRARFIERGETMKHLGFALLASLAIVAPAQGRTSHHYSCSHDSYGPATGRHYTNVNGDSVHSPMHASRRPAGATAQCGDGTWSFSQH